VVRGQVAAAARQPASVHRVGGLHMATREALRRRAIGNLVPDTLKPWATGRLVY
jgi:hypothetical protein